MGATNTLGPTTLLLGATVLKSTSSSETEGRLQTVLSTVTLLRDTLSMAISCSSIVSLVFIRYAASCFMFPQPSNASQVIHHVPPCKSRRRGPPISLTSPIGQGASMALLPTERVRMQPI